MNKRIRSMIDAIFCEMKMTAENLALRDELMANAFARFEDAMAQGKTEEQAFAEVAASLEDVGDLLSEMNEEGKEQAVNKEETPAQEEHAETQSEDEAQESACEDPQTDLGDALNKAFSALGSWGQSIMPQARKLARQMDDATGGVLSDIGRAVNKGVQDAQKAAGDVLDRCQKGQGAADAGNEKTPQDLREEAKDLRAQADIKRAVGDAAAANALNGQAELLDARADAIEQEAAMHQARREAEQEPPSVIYAHGADTAPQEEIFGADGEIDEDAFARSVEEMSREAEEIVRETAADGREFRGNELRFPAAGLRKVSAELDADSVTIEPSDTDEIIVRWMDMKEGESPRIRLDNHTLSIGKKNDDMIKTFLSIFNKDGGKISVLVPRGYAADYQLSTTSGEIRLSGVDADGAKISTTSGCVRVEPDLAVRAEEINVHTISGDVTVSAMAQKIEAESVSGKVFISCDAGSVKGDVVSGRLHIEGACDHWEAETVSGSVELVCTAVPTGSVKIDTISGGAKLYLPAAIRGFAVEFDSISGTLTNEFGPERYGTCALPVHMDTISGRMIIARL